MAKSVKNNPKWRVSLIGFAVLIIISIVPSLDLPFNVSTWNDAYEKADLNTGADADVEPLSVHYIDVGQGDCIFIKSSSGNMLIDAGEKGNDEKILSYLHNQGVDTIDYLVATHPHSDHIGSMPKVIAGLKVKNVIMPELSEINMPTTKGYENFLIAVKSSGAKVIVAEAAKEYLMGDVSFVVLSPSQQSKNLNNMSVVIKLSYKNTDFLFMGDAEQEIEQELIEKGYDISADVLKIGHHGSETSSTEIFLKSVKPSFAIISCGEDNSYNHPNINVLKTLETYNIDYKRTDESGTIVVGSDGDKLTISTEKEAS
ncbi:MAG: MBL fold metallo-hydrolase [Clostridia bacterium]|nr:MBL fold metallo-hydrolase [Clostridia bacterium]